VSKITPPTLRGQAESGVGEKHPHELTHLDRDRIIQLVFVDRALEDDETAIILAWSPSITWCRLGKP
jgi:hypothetical protein